MFSHLPRVHDGYLLEMDRGVRGGHCSWTELRLKVKGQASVGAWRAVLELVRVEAVPPTFAEFAKINTHNTHAIT